MFYAHEYGWLDALVEATGGSQKRIEGLLMNSMRHSLGSLVGSQKRIEGLTKVLFPSKPLPEDLKRELKDGLGVEVGFDWG